MTFAASLIVLGSLLTGVAGADDPPRSVQQLYEAGQYQQAVDLARTQLDADPPAGPDIVFLLAQSLVKLDDKAGAREVLSRLVKPEETPDAWSAVAQSGIAVIDGDQGAALDAARRAVELGPELFHAHYQLGIVEALRADFAASSAALEQATLLNPGFAYAHYAAGMAWYRVKRLDKMAIHFESFIRLAPEAPERPAVEQLMRTIKRR
jgi:tetratricopeptide (TPR) repeat protein